MTIEDVYETLAQQNMMFIREATPVPGQVIRLAKNRRQGSSMRRTHDEFVAPKEYAIRFSRERVKGYLREWERKGYLVLRAEKLQWTPYLVTRRVVIELVDEDAEGSLGSDGSVEYRL
jgi:histone acetyltransferase MYST4